MTSAVPNPSFFQILRNPYLIGLFAIWLITKLYTLFGADLSLLRYGDQEPIFNTMGQVGMLVFISILLFLARRQGIRPIDHTSNLGITRQNAFLETVWLLVYMFVVTGLGLIFNIHTHVGFHVVNDGTQDILGLEPATSSIVWSVYNSLVYVVIPLTYFVGIKRYSAKSLLLGFPKPRAFMPFAVVAGIAGFAPFLTPEYFTTSLSAHAITFFLYMLGTILPVAIFTQALLAPRFAILTRSWVTGAVLTSVAYTALNLNEYFLEWDSAEKVGLSLISLLAGDLMWGLLKGMSTLIVGSAWMHIFTTHTLHFADAPAVAKAFGIR